MGIKLKLKRVAPTVLCFLAAGGVVGTAVLTGKATLKAYEHCLDKDEEEPFLRHASKKELVKECWKYYIPAISVGTGTMICIFGSNILNKRTQASLVAGYSLVKDAYQEYQDKVKELYGEETHNAVMDAIMKEHCEPPIISSVGFCSCSSLDIETLDPEVKRTFYDVFSQRYFESTLSNVIQAEYHLNRNYVLGGAVCVNELYEFLGLEPIAGGDELIWDISSEFYWLDFNHRTATLDDGMEVVLIQMELNPEMSTE